MDSAFLDKRKSGIPLIGDLAWGTHFGHFYATKKDLFDILLPYLKTGLENNELCVWVTSGLVSTDGASRVLEDAIPDFKRYCDKGQIEIVPSSRWHRRGEQLAEAIVSRLDRGISEGFDGLRLAWGLPPDKKGSGAFLSLADGDAISRHNVIALIAYPRNQFDAVGLIEVARNHGFALVRNGDTWEIIESSEATIAKDALRKSEEKLRSLFSHMAEGFAHHRIVLDGKGTPCDYVFLEVNDAFERLTGLKGEDIIGRRATEALPGIEKDPMDWIGRYGKVALTGKPTSFESYSQPLDRWYSVSAFSPHKGFFATTFSDITERKKAETELLKTKTEWERTFNSVPDLIAIMDNQHRIMRVNLAMANRLGVTPERCIGLYCHEAVHGLAAAPGYCPLSLTCLDGQQHIAEVHEPRLGGDFLISTTPLRDAGDQPTGAVHVARDITDLKRAEKALRQRTLDLEAANEEMSSFSYMVSHDLRAPLRSMDGYSQALLEDYADKLDAQCKEWLQNIRDSSQMMGQLINDILGLSRVVRTELKVETVDLSDVARSVAQRLKETDPGRSVDFDVASGMYASADANLIRLVLENLLGNAFKYTSSRRDARIEFGMEEWNGKNAYYVRDNGAGFDMKYVGKLFKPFQRLHSDKEFPGSGIGLVTVQRVIRRHGGEVWAEGEVGKGATFCFTLGAQAIARGTETA